MLPKQKAASINAGGLRQKKIVIGVIIAIIVGAAFVVGLAVGIHNYNKNEDAKQQGTNITNEEATEKGTLCRYGNRRKRSSKAVEDTSCIPLGTCPTFAWFLEANQRCVGIQLDKMQNILRSKRCGTERTHDEEQVTNETKVACPNPTDYADYDENMNDNGTEIDSGIVDGEVGSGGVNDIVDLCGRGDNDGVFSVSEPRYEEPRCSLQIVHGAQQSTLDTLETLRFTGTKYSKLCKLIRRRRKVIRVASHGNCCWEIYPRAGFLGKELKIVTGYESFPDFEPRSLKKFFSCR